MLSIGPGRQKERERAESSEWEEARKKENILGCQRQSCSSWARMQERRRCSHGQSRLQEPEKHIGTHTQGNTGQKGGGAEESDFSIWNQTHKQMTHIYLRRFRLATWSGVGISGVNTCVLGMCAMKLACYVASPTHSSRIWLQFPLCNILTDYSTLTQRRIIENK